LEKWSWIKGKDTRKGRSEAGLKNGGEDTLVREKCFYFRRWPRDGKPRHLRKPQMRRRAPSGSVTTQAEQGKRDSAGREEPAGESTCVKEGGQQFFLNLEDNTNRSQQKSEIGRGYVRKRDPSENVRTEGSHTIRSPRESHEVSGGNRHMNFERPGEQRQDQTAGYPRSSQRMLPEVEKTRGSTREKHSRGRTRGRLDSNQEGVVAGGGSE